ncbi:MAG: PKD domain-containing protein, partial [Bacteroidetes bacterium]|nr:PKD domain-containing protein [Bacteroidota bacterium]
MKTSIIFKVLLLVISLLPVININSQTILTVTKTTDPDPFLFPYDYQDSLCDPIMYGSFQWAIRKANDTPDPCHIVFQIPGTGTHVISLNYFLPPVMNRVFIDGTSQTSYTYSQPSVIIDGSNLIVEGNISSTYFLVFRAGISGPSIDSSCVKGLQVQNFSNSYGITINASYITIKDNIFISTGGEIETPKGMVYFPTLYISAPFNQVKGNIFGTDYTETDSLGSAGGGIFLRQFSKMSAYSCIIGDTLPGDGNIISNNKRYGISLESGDASNRISGNKTYNNDINIYIMSRTIPQPEITGVTQVSGNTIVEGSSVPGYVIELFGSTGGTNANKFYISTIADPQGLWTASIAGFNFPYIVATATDIANNTSGFSNSFEVQPGCNLIVDAGHDTTVTAGSPVALGGNPTASGGMGPYAYAWTPVTGLDDPANANPVATPFFSVNYTLTVSDEFGCTASDEINIRVRPETPLITPGGVFDTILDMYGNKYLLSDLSVSNALSGNNSYQTKSTMLCSPAGYFNLYFEEGSDMEGSGVQEQRREVICQLFRDISAFIASPLETNGLDNHVNIWVRDFNNIPNTGGALGIASPFYCLPAGASTVGGIADNEIWKTIISGFDSYTNVASPILTVGGQSLSFFHGMVAFDFSSFNWHAQLSDNTSHSLYDLYTVALHEVTHSMGFASLIAVDGSSKFAPNYNYYSRYDLFLQTQDGEDLITNTGGCSLYDYAFAGGDLITINPFDCDNAILFGGTVNQLVYSNPPFSNGTSLSHFEDVCHRLGGVDDPKANDSYYVMSDSYNPTFTLMKRIYTPEERNVLCNLGYSVSAIWGSGIAHNYFDYGDNFCVENHVVGINDGINSDGTFRWQVNTGILNIDIPAIQFLENDFVTPPSVTPFGFECLEVIYGSGNVSVSSGSSGDIVHFTVPTIMEPGVRILRYIPISDGIRGNITYLYIWVLDGTCSSSASCNLVNNSNFEDVVYCGNGAVASGLSCWNSISGTVDLFQRGCSGGYNVGTYTHPETQPVESHDGSPNDAFLGFLASQEVTNVKYYEATQTILSSPLIPGEEYKLSFWVRSAHEISWWTDQSNLIYFAATQNLVSGIDCYSPLFSSLPNATRLFDDPIEIPYDPATTYNGWHYREITFPFQGNQPCQNLIIYNDIWDQPTVSGNQYSFYFFLDDVRIESVDNATVSFSPPTTLCLGQEIDLSNFADPPGGEFNGTGVVGTYFSSDIAGVFDVTYTIENNLGCVIEKTEQIQVISIPDIPSFEVSNLCQPQVTFEVQNYDPLLTYQFDFDNTNSLSLPLTSQTIQHNYDAPGYYRVSLVVSNGYCSSHYSEVINIVPHSNSPEYNQEHNPALVLDCQCCSENLSYDFEQEITTGQGSIPLTGIPQITFRKNMKIPDGSIVTITNSTLRFGPQAGIIIEPGGKLVLNNGAVLSGLSDCGGLMWQGIEVQGIRSLAHYYPYPDDDIPHPSQSQQGHLEITGNATISDAHTAIFVGKRRVCIPDMYYGVPFVLCKFIMGNQPPYNNLLFYEPNSGGGILNLNGGEINRCAVGIYI